MPLLEPLKAIFEAYDSASLMLDNTSPILMREAMHQKIEQILLAFCNLQEPVWLERDIAIPVDDGQITLRLYRDYEGPEALPCHIYYHGGGFCLGTLDHSNNYCRALARATSCSVISVDYRLAPEHRFPAAVEDSYAALCWVAANAEELSIDPARISVGGTEAGGNLAAVVAQIARDHGAPAISAQVLEIPVTDFTSASTLDFPDEGIHIAAGKSYASLYLSDEADIRNPVASPLLANSLQKLPTALVICAEYDRLRPEGEAYARRLQESGVPTTYRFLAGEFPGSQSFDKLISDRVEATRAATAGFLRGAYERSYKRN